MSDHIKYQFKFLKQTTIAKTNTATEYLNATFKEMTEVLSI